MARFEQFAKPRIARRITSVGIELVYCASISDTSGDQPSCHRRTLMRSVHVLRPRVWDKELGGALLSQIRTDQTANIIAPRTRNRLIHRVPAAFERLGFLSSTKPHYLVYSK